MIGKTVVAEKDQAQTQSEDVEGQFDLAALNDELSNEHAQGAEKQEAGTEDLEFAATEHLQYQGLPKPCAELIE